MKKECEIVQDLLPNYLENLTKEETNNFIEDHIKRCEECKNVYDSMKEETEATLKNNTKTVNYMKKFKKHLRLLKIIILIIVLAIVLVIGRKIIILEVLDMKSNTTIKNFGDNYYMKKTTYKDGVITITEAYNIGNDYLTTTKSKNFDGSTYEMINYKKGEELINLFSNENVKIQSDKIVGGKIAPSVGTSSFLSNISIAFSTKIEKVTINNKECYLLHYNTSDKYIDIDTGLIIREIDSNGTYTDYSYKFSEVEEEDIMKPDLTGYVLQQ